MCGEYGDQTHRPHYHALLFNHDFMDKTKWAFRNNNTIYRSKSLEKLWPYGLSEIGNVTFQSAAYVARYVMKKITGEQAKEHYKGLTPEYNKMSLRPGIGKQWFDKYKTDIFPGDFVPLAEGKKSKTPPYYDKLLEKESPITYEHVKKARLLKAELHAENNTPERLKVREIVTKSKLRKLKRELQ